MKQLKKLVLAIALHCITCSLYAWPITRLITEPNEGDTPFINAITHAKQKIDLVMYGFTDGHIRKALIDAHERGVNVRIILEHTPYLSLNENRYTIKILRRHHIAVADAPPGIQLVHQKTLIIDNKAAWIMTLNFTYSAFHKQRNFAVIDDNLKDITEIESVFNADWQQRHLKQQTWRLLWSPINMRSSLLHLIQSASHSIKIYAMGLNDYKIIGALAQAAKKGVAVKLLMTNAYNKLNYSKLHYLKKAGVVVHLNQFPIIHAKMILVDDSKAYVGSANFTKASLDNNRELGVEVRNPAILELLNHQFLQDWTSSERDG